ncbi:MAG TPA: carbohydrate porin [Bdellovibrionales bacterium]|nr:carbohydrate porin [Bdellovibrionales bacterium]
MRTLISLAISVLTFASLAHADESKREPAMQDFQDHSVIQETVVDPTKGAWHWEAAYTGEVGRNMTGGNRVGSFFLSLATLRSSFDLEPLAGWKGASAFIHLQATHGDDPSQFVGDSQLTSNIEAPADTAKLYEAWFEQKGFDGKASLLFGVYDLNSEFYVSEPAGLFLNSSFGIGTEIAQTGRVSIFPSPGLGLRVKAEVNDEFYLQTAVFEGTAGDPDRIHGTQIKYDPSEGQYVIIEAAQHSENHKYAVGGWSFTQPGPVANTGVYIIGNQNLTEKVAVFARYGTASAEANRFRSNLGAGLVFTGLLPSRPEDQCGLAFTSVSNGDVYVQTSNAAGVPVDRDETTIELTYQISLGGDVSVQPDLQYVINPDTDPNRENALVASLRFRIGIED